MPNDGCADKENIRAGGWGEMCEASEKWYKEGEAVGEMKAKQETALKH